MKLRGVEFYGKVRDIRRARLLTITEDYIVRILPTVREANSPYGILQFNGKRIELPKALQHYPSVHNLSWHRKEKFVLE